MSSCSYWRSIAAAVHWFLKVNLITLGCWDCVWRGNHAHCECKGDRRGRKCWWERKRAPDGYGWFLCIISSSFRWPQPFVIWPCRINGNMQYMLCALSQKDFVFVETFIRFQMPVFQEVMIIQIKLLPLIENRNALGNHLVLRIFRCTKWICLVVIMKVVNVSFKLFIFTRNYVSGIQKVLSLDLNGNTWSSENI